VVELEVRDVVDGRAIQNSEAIANPHVFEEFKIDLNWFYEMRYL